MGEKRQNRSDKYQYVLLETMVSDDHLNSYSNQASIYHALNPFEYDEDVLELEDELMKEVMKLVDMHLTKHQKQIVMMRLDGYTQMEIAKVLDIHQSSVHKSLMGNLDMFNDKKRYGGSIHKLKKLAKNNQRIRQLLSEIRELREEKVW